MGNEQRGSFPWVGNIQVLCGYFDSLNNQQFWFFKNLRIKRTSGSEGKKLRFRGSGYF